jgi:hypothetical protein
LTNEDAGEIVFNLEKRVTSSSQKERTEINAAFSVRFPGFRTVAAVSVLTIVSALVARVGAEIYVRRNSPYGYVTPESLLRLRVPFGPSNIESPLITYKIPLIGGYVRLHSSMSDYAKGTTRGNLRIGSEGAITEGQYVSKLSETALRRYSNGRRNLR